MINQENTLTNKNILTKSEKLIIILISLFSSFIHEIGHFIGYKLDGITVKLGFFWVEPQTGSNGFWGILGGILIQIILILSFLLIAYVFKHKKDFWLAMCLPMILARLIPYMIFSVTSLIFNRNVFMYNDEQYIANLFNIPISTSYIFFIIIFIIFWIILRAKLNKKFFYKINYVASTCILFLGIIATWLTN